MRGKRRGTQNMKWQHWCGQQGGDMWYCMQIGHVTWTIKKRRNDVEELVQYMGCEDCENLSHSMTVVMNDAH
ncbi:hypothetical protein RHSIM_Rhsim05G0099900 [Rhododendron simsii]|uniref:Uncharacterized protein n=1 Tax=Rhododendron simsii TaxID=118357 RepID=A0A834GZE2_RHOSS|nr:hypothetical protein RHSIM_Rhsim05G0099900 [Rhododendron simsii]